MRPSTPSYLLFGGLAAVQAENALRRCKFKWTRLLLFNFKESDGVQTYYHRISSKQTERNCDASADDTCDHRCYTESEREKFESDHCFMLHVEQACSFIKKIKVLFVFRGFVSLDYFYQRPCVQSR